LLFERRAVDIVQPDITMCGGLWEARKISAWAESNQVLVAPDNVGGAISTAAPGNPGVADGHFALPAGPGLGVTLDRAVVAEHPRRSLYFDLHSRDWQLRQAETAGAGDGPGAHA
jgi:galactonate dehydratase